MPTLVPGPTPAGWAATAAPAQQGTSTNLGYDYMPSARWQNPCGQTYGGTGTGELASLTLDIVAFHPCGRDRGNEGIQKITFIANNGTPLDVTAPTLNPGGWFTWNCTLGTLTDDGPVEVRAIVYPYDGVPFVMQGGYRTTTPFPTSEQSLIAWSNASVAALFTRTPVYIGAGAFGGSAAGNDSTGNGTLALPFATIQKALTTGLGGDYNNAFILCNPGTYVMPINGGTVSGRSRWLTIQPASGVTRAQVILGSGSGASRSPFSLIRLRKVTIDQSVDPKPFLGRSSGDQVYIWLDTQDLFGKGRVDGLDSNLKSNSSVAISYVTAESRTSRALLRDWTDASNAVGSQINLGFDHVTISGDLANVPNVRDCDWRDQKSVGGVHGDWVQESQVSKENCIWLDNRVDDCQVQLWFQTDTIKIIRHAYVNNILFKDPADGKGNNMRKCEGCVYWNNTHGNQSIDYAVQVRTGAGEASGMELSIGSSIYANIMAGDLQTGTFQVLSTPITTSNFTTVATGLVWDYTHSWKNAGYAPGNNASSGTVTYRNAASRDYYPLGPAVVISGVPRTVRWDQKQTARNSLTYRGALEYDGTTSTATLAPVFSPVPGTYESARIVSITSESGASIFYTVNSSTPTVASTLYTGPVTISVTTTLKALATKTGLTNSSVTTGLYTISTSAVPAAPSIVVSAVGSVV